MTFEKTGLHVPFDLLVKSDRQDAVKYDHIKELQSQGKILDEIAEEFGYSDKSGICKWVSRYENIANTRKSLWPKDDDTRDKYVKK